MNLPFLPFLITLIVLVFFINWRQCVKTALFILIIEGALRKWVWPEYGHYIFFLKDFVILAAYIKFYSSPSLLSKNIGRKEPLILLFVMFSAVICLIQAFNPNLGSPILGLFGAKNYLLYIPLIYLIAHLFESQEELYKFLRKYLLLVVPIGLLGFVQYFSPNDSLINRYAWEGAPDVAGWGSRPRITGTFSYISGYGTYLMICAALLLPLITTKERFYWKGVYVLILLLIIVNMFMTGSRGPVIFFVLLLIGYLFCNNPSKVLMIFRRLVIPLMVCSIAIIWWFQPQFQLFMERLIKTDSVIWRIADSLKQLYLLLTTAGLGGYGSGATYQAADIIRNVFHLPAGKHFPVFSEGEVGKIMLELGVIGFTFWYTLKVILMVTLWKTYQRLKLLFLRRLALSAFLVHAILITGSIVFNTTFSLYYWFLTGFIFLLPQMELVEKMREIEGRTSE